MQCGADLSISQVANNFMGTEACPPAPLVFIIANGSLEPPLKSKKNNHEFKY